MPNGIQLSEFFINYIKDLGTKRTAVTGVALHLSALMKYMFEHNTFLRKIEYIEDGDRYTCKFYDKNGEISPDEMDKKYRSDANHLIKMTGMTPGWVFSDILLKAHPSAFTSQNYAF